MYLPDAAGPADPVPQSPPRRPGSARRTSTIDVSRPDGMPGDLRIDARARDLRTAADGTGAVVGEVVLRARVDGGRHVLQELEEVEITGREGAEGPGAEGAEVASRTSAQGSDLAALVGTRVGSGFRGQLDQALGEESTAGTLRYLLLDDLPGATLISGYALQRAAFAAGHPLPARYEMMASRADICAGWAADATILTTIRHHEVVPVPMGPPAPVLEPPDDPLSWHATDPLPPRSTRRRRLLDLWPDGQDGLALWCHFRDSHVDGEGEETVLHEYSVTGTVDIAGARVLDLAAHVQVLPWIECPGAVASAGRLAGADVAVLREWVRRELTGTSTCTHLNDTLRALAAVPHMVALADRLGA